MTANSLLFGWKATHIVENKAATVYFASKQKYVYLKKIISKNGVKMISNFWWTVESAQDN